MRLKLVPTPGPVETAKAFSTGSVDLAVVRGDVGELADARAGGCGRPSVVLLVAPPGSTWIDISEIKRERDVTAVNAAALCLENLIHDRRIALASRQGGQASG
ncbi:hypothetical protein JJC00_17400 [Bradyrhizobium diazoefficiens]|uniref:hypothetical protein n=1 Tax=Bradyrhizobium diazoefficiens TaxID=1355477 RepID=UPI00190ABAE2|nr:hypothetical protein [Bradyrhizobium diazoefficiens]QQO37225.1 hypothetical protein JJC00_17400 [Bradyrhizobium diazoefficiens]